MQENLSGQDFYEKRTRRSLEPEFVLSTLGRCRNMADMADEESSFQGNEKSESYFQTTENIFMNNIFQFCHTLQIDPLNPTHWTFEILPSRPAL